MILGGRSVPPFWFWFCFLACLLAARRAVKRCSWVYCLVVMVVVVAGCCVPVWLLVRRRLLPASPPLPNLLVVGAAERGTNTNRLLLPQYAGQGKRTKRADRIIKIPLPTTSVRQNRAGSAVKCVVLILANVFAWLFISRLSHEITKSSPLEPPPKKIL